MLNTWIVECELRMEWFEVEEAVNDVANNYDG